MGRTINRSSFLSKRKYGVQKSKCFADDVDNIPAKKSAKKFSFEELLHWHDFDFLLQRLSNIQSRIYDITVPVRIHDWVHAAISNLRLKQICAADHIVMVQLLQPC